MTASAGFSEISSTETACHGFSNVVETHSGDLSLHAETSVHIKTNTNNLYFITTHLNDFYKYMSIRSESNSLLKINNSKNGLIVFHISDMT